MGPWGPDAPENDAAAGWLGSLERIGLIAVATPMVEIGEYAARKKPVPPEIEQAFWAMCEVVGIAGGLISPAVAPPHADIIRREAAMILGLPALERRIRWVVDHLAQGTTELEDSWDDAGEGAAFRQARDRAMAAPLQAAARSG